MKENSYRSKLILTNLREAGMRVCAWIQRWNTGQRALHGGSHGMELAAYEARKRKEEELLNYMYENNKCRSYRE